MPAGADDDPPLTVQESVAEAALVCRRPPDGGAKGTVLLVHGLGATGEENWGWNYAGVLPALGFTACTIDMPDRGWGDMQISSEYLVHAVRELSAASGRRLSILGHSQGGIEPRWALRWWPGLRKLTEDVITLGTPHHGVVDPDLGGLVCPVACAPPALWQLREGSRFLRALNSEDETPGDVAFTSIWSRTDEIVQPLALGRETSVLSGGSNLAIQDLCPGRVVTHVALAAHAATFALVIDALTHAGAAEGSRFDPRVCLQPTLQGLAPAQARGDVLDAVTAGLTTERVRQEPGLFSYAANRG